jgi:hypothetical protein
MRTAKQVFFEMSVGEQSASKWISDIRKAQKEAYNEAIRDVQKLFENHKLDIVTLLDLLK